MVIVASAQGFSIADPDDFSRFHVDAAVVSPGDFAALLEGSTVVSAHVEPDHVWVATTFIADALDVARNQSRRQGLDAMLAFAAKKGWLDESGSKIAAHVETGER